VNLTRSDWRRVVVLVALSLTVAVVVVLQSGSGDDPPAAAPRGDAIAPGPSASEQVEDAADSLAPEAEPTPTDGIGTRPVDDIPADGPGTFTGALTGPVTFGDPLTATREIQFSVAVEDEIGVDATELAQFVDQVLSDERSWPAGSDTVLVRVAEGGEFQLVVSSPSTTDQLCEPLQTIGQLSCTNAGVIAINVVRWETASAGWTSDLETYRQWVVNHELGHLLGHSHVACAGGAELADVMQQQSIDLDGCLPNPWPYPDGPPPRLDDSTTDEPTGETPDGDAATDDDADPPG